MSPPRSCRQCEFFEPSSGTGGHCKRYAPRPFQQTVVSDDPSDYPEMPHFPYMEGDDWCGEFVRDFRKT